MPTKTQVGKLLTANGEQNETIMSPFISSQLQKKQINRKTPEKNVISKTAR